MVDTISFKDKLKIYIKTIFQAKKTRVLEYHGLNMIGRKQSKLTSETDERMERREANTSINITKGHIMLMLNEASLRLLIFFIALILLVFIIQFNRTLCYILFLLLLCSIFCLILLHIRLLPKILLCPPSPISLARQKHSVTFPFLLYFFS